MQKLKLYFDLKRARRAYRKAEAACMRAASSDAVYGMWEALDRIRFEFGEQLIDAECAYLRGV